MAEELPIEVRACTLTTAQLADLARTAKTPPTATGIHTYHGGDFHAPNGMSGDWFSYCNHDGSGCGPEYWKFPVAPYRDMKVDGGRCTAGTVQRVPVTIKWGS